MNKGIIFIVSSPSGCGKTTIIRNFLKQNKKGYYFSISHTTRPKRKNEINGKDYYFISKEEFMKMIKEDKFLEWAVVHNNYYGTSKEKVIENLNKGIDVILDIDVQGAEKIKKNKDLENFDIVSIFIFPPSFSELKRRLLKRGAEDDKSLNIRLENAKKELERFSNYDYIIINDQLSKAIEEFSSILKSQRLKTKYQIQKIEKILKNWEDSNGKGNNWGLSRADSKQI